MKKQRDQGHEQRAMAYTQEAKRVSVDFCSSPRDNLASLDAAVNYIEAGVLAGQDIFEMSGLHYIHERRSGFSVLTVLLPAALYDGLWPWADLHEALGEFAASSPFANLVGAIGVCVEQSASVIDLHVETIGHHKHRTAVVDAHGRLGAFHANEKQFDEGGDWPVCPPDLPANRADYEAAWGT